MVDSYHCFGDTCCVQKMH